MVRRGPMRTHRKLVGTQAVLTLPRDSVPRMQELHRSPITDTSITPPVRRQERALEGLRKGVAARIFLVKPTASQGLVFARISSWIAIAFSMARRRRSFASSCAKYSSTAWRKKSLRFRPSFAAARSIALSNLSSIVTFILATFFAYSHSMVLGGFEEMS